MLGKTKHISPIYSCYTCSEVSP